MGKTPSGVSLVILSAGPKGGVVYIDSEMLVNVFAEYHDEIHIFIDDSFDPEYSHAKLRIHRIRRRATERHFLPRLFGYIEFQIKLAWSLLKHSGSIEINWFIFGGELLTLPILALSLFRKKRAAILTGSPYREQMVRSATLLNRILVRLVWMQQNLGYLLMNRIVAYSSNMVRFGGLEPFRHKVDTWHYFVVKGTEFRPHGDFNERENIVSFIGRVDTEKGSLKVADAIPLIASQYPGVKFLIIGAGPELVAMKSKIASSGYQDKVEFQEWLPRDELPKQMNRARVVTIPSETEGLPNVMIECMACGVVPVATPVGDIPSILKDRETGYLLQDSNPETIAATVIHALADPGLAKMSEKATNIVNNLFSYENAVNSYQRTLETLTGKLRALVNQFSLCILAPPDSINKNVAARSVFVEVYQNYLTSFGHDINWVVPARREEESPVSHNRDNVYTVSYSKGTFAPMIAINRLLSTYKKARAVIRLSKIKRFHLVQAGDNLLDGLVAYYIKKRFGTPYVFKQDNTLEKEWYSTARGYRVLYPAIVLLVFLSNLAFRWTLRGADLVLVTSKVMVDRLAKRGVPRQKMTVLPRGANIDLFSPNVNRQVVRQKYSLGEGPVILYLGTTARIRQLGIIMKALVKVKERSPSAKLLIVGEGDTSVLETIASSQGVRGDVILTGLVPYSEVPNYIAASDIALCPVPPLDIYTVSSPTKLFEYMAVARPVIANIEIPEHKEVLEQSGGGILVPFDEEAFARSIIELLDDPDRARQMGLKGRQWVEEVASYERLARNLESEFLHLVNSKLEKNNVHRVR